MMKFSCAAVLAFFIFTGGTNFLRAQASDPLTAFLTPEQQKQYALAHQKALADNPALKAEAEPIMKEMIAEGPHLTPETTAKMNAHRDKLRAAMLKEDPTLKPLFTEIDEHLAAAKAKQLGQVQNSSSPSGTSSH